jgi:hypothetical protein
MNADPKGKFEACTECGPRELQDIRGDHPTPKAKSRALTPASVVLQGLLDKAPADHFTLAWLLDHLHGRSFGFIVLILALIAMVPGISMVAGVLLMITALEMITGRAAPVFPRGVASRSLPTRHLSRVVGRAIPVMRYLEKAIHPRWNIPLESTKRVVGVAILLLALLLLAPVPLIQVVPATAIGLLSLAYLEEDGVLLALALLAALVVLAIAVAAAWEMVVGAVWIGRF